MALDTVEAYALNIAANPHPAGVYIRSLNRASELIIKVRGSDYARITKPKQEDERFYSGRVLVWTEIDLKGRWLDTSKEDVLSERVKRTIRIPTEAKPNYRVFNYVFDEKRHILYFESRNEFNEHFGPTVGRRLFVALLDRDYQGRQAPEFAVTLLPEEAAVTRILAMPRLRTLTIRITKPNPDLTASEARRRVFDELDASNSKQRETTYTKEAGAERLEPTPDMEAYAEVGATDGFVKGIGRGTSKGKAELSTDELPRKFILNQDDGSSFFSRLLSKIRV